MHKVSLVGLLSRYRWIPGVTPNSTVFPLFSLALPHWATQFDRGVWQVQLKGALAYWALGGMASAWIEYNLWPHSHSYL